MATLLRSDGTWKCLGYPSSAPISKYDLYTAMNETYSVLLALNMTSNTAPSPYVASASSIYNSTYNAYKAFNGSNSSNTDCWVSANGQTTGWLQIDLGGQKSIIGYAITSRNESSTGTTAAPRSWTFLGSNDGTNWVTLDSRSDVTNWTYNETKTFDVTFSDYYRYYRLNITANNGHSSYVAVGELTLYTGSWALSNVVQNLGVFRLAATPGTGYGVSAIISLAGMQASAVPVLNWDGDVDGVTFELDVSLDAGSTWSGWQVVGRGAPIPGVDQNTNLDNVRFRCRLTLASDGEVSPVVSNIRIDNIVSWTEPSYADASWSLAYNNGTYGISPFGSNPSGWPDSSACWIWDRASTSSALAGDVYFRKRFTLAEPKWVTVAFACDDKAELYVDGQYLLGNANWKSTFANTVYLLAGDHVIAIKGTNSAAGTAGLLVTVRDAFAGLAGSGVITGSRLTRVFEGIKAAVTFGLRQARNLMANVYVVDIFNTGPATRKAGDYFLGVRSAIDQEVPVAPPPSYGGTMTPVRRFPFSWIPFVHQRWKPR